MSKVMSKTLAIAAGLTMLMAAGASTAHARLVYNGLSQNGFTINGVRFNALAFNGSSFQGLDPNGLRVNDAVGVADPSRLRLRAIRLPGE